MSHAFKVCADGEANQVVMGGSPLYMAQVAIILQKSTRLSSWAEV